MPFEVKLGPRRKAQAERVSFLAQTLGVDILAHFYQRREVKELANVVGGSQRLYRAALDSQAKAVMICGVDFLVQTLERLRPDLEILVPRPDADCPFSRSVAPEEAQLIRHGHPDTILVADLKASGLVRDLCDLELSSLKDWPTNTDRPICVLPALSDGDPGKLVHSQWPGAVCQVHRQVTAQNVEKALESLPGAKLAVNSLCLPDVRQMADFVGNSQSIFDYCLNSPKGDFLIISESGLVESLKLAIPESRFFETDTEVFCPNMKLTNIKDMLHSLEAFQPSIAAGQGLVNPVGLGR
jgi:quinolinate synthase